jgi:hexosaminidase
LGKCKFVAAVSFSFVLSGLLICPQSIGAQTSTPLQMMPLPAHATQGEGQFLIDGGFAVTLQGYTEPRLLRARQRFMDTLSRETGIPFPLEAQSNQQHFVVETGGPSSTVQQVEEDESYQLEISPTMVRLKAKNPLGVMHGLQTFLQLVRVTPEGFSVPAVSIDDQPRFPWRGLMLDVSRHFIPIPVIERDLDGMEAVKLNVFHWHISDDQGFRAESKQFPALQEKGSDGLYYTQSQIRDVIEYAHDRGIRVVPEFDMPCHTTSWLVGYPNLGSGKAPYEIARRFGIQNAAMDPTKDSTYQFVDTFVGEMASLFPDQYFHIGGDECNGKDWNSNPGIQSFMHAHGMANNAALQAYFTAKVQKIVADHHKVMEGWDEVLQPGTPKNVLIQSWRGQASLAQAARQGNRGILSTGYYIDLNQTASQHYLVDPMGGDAATLTPAQKQLILGGEAAMWSEFVTAENVDTRIWPRTAAIAERLWSPDDVKDVDSMYRREGIVAEKLNAYGINVRGITSEMLQRMSGDPDPIALGVLATAVQPPTGFRRTDEAIYGTSTPLTHLVDAVPPESDKARQFGELTRQIVSGKATAAQWQQAREWLVVWRDNDAQLEPLLRGSSLTEELVPVSQSLSQVAATGLKALDNLQGHHGIGEAARQQDLELLKAAEQPKAILLDEVAPSVELLVKAVRKE